MTFTHGFELIEERAIPEMNSTARYYRHGKTGAELLSISNDDENKVFGINFRTPPGDSTGVPHIMEHSVLCGSQKYPLKEPFVELIKGSLKTFLNAFTFPDKTCYPVASQNTQDFYNLIDVYMDAVLHPLLPEHTLQQEGWHYELDNLDAPLAYKGVVFNEMKGAYSSPDNVLGRYSQQVLFPDNTYGVDSGGDPTVMPNLTYAQFKTFHATFYHPSNARIFFYGDDDPEERLRLMDGYLREFERREVRSEIALQERFSEPKRVVMPYAVGEDEARKGRMTVNWMLTQTGGDPETRLGLIILSYILIGTPASPLRKALIDSGLGEDLAGGGLDDDLLQAIFSTGMKGIQAGQDGQQPGADAVENLILQTLEELASEGIDPAMIEAAMNTTEFRLRENNTGAFPRGIVLMLRSLGSWLYGANPIAPLAFEQPLSEIKRKVAQGKFFEELIRRYFLENPHRVTLILQPDSELQARQEAEERQKLEQIRQGMSAEELNQIVENTRELKRRQEAPDSPEALASIPSLKLSDLDRQIKIIPLDLQEAAGAPVLYHDLFTNGIVYLDLGLNLHALPQQYIPYLSLFGRVLFEMGTEKEDFVRLSQRIGRTTGGIYATSYTSTPQIGKGSLAWLFLRGKATLEHTQDLLDILRDVLLTVRLDNRERFRQMVLEEKADMEAGLVPSGHRVVNTRLRAIFDEAGWLAEKMGGVSYLFFLRKLAERVDQDWASVQADLEAMRSLLVNRGGMLLNVTLDSASFERIRPQMESFLDEIPAAPTDFPDWEREPAEGFEGLTIPAQVNYVGKGANLYDLGYEYHASAAVINNYLRTTWLWEKIRVQGGAYGGFCLFDRRSGVFTFLSYRDPNLLKTLENYDAAAAFLLNLDESRLSPEELTKSIIGVIGEMDAYQLPDAKGFTSMVRYLAGDTDEDRQQRREEVLATTAADFKRFGEVLMGVKGHGKVVVLGSAEAIEKANQQRGGWLKVSKVL